jgi:uncharacterized protein
MGETKLDILLKTMNPTLNPGEYVFCSMPELSVVPLDDIVLLFREQEGITIILKKEKADQLNFSYSFIASWISLTVHSSLEAVGLTAAFSNALTEGNISCNVVAGYYHDHIFVDIKDRERATVLLKELSK